MPLRYHHIQIGWAGIVGLAVGFCVMLGVFFFAQRAQIPPVFFALMFAVFALLFLVFGRLTTEVDSEQFRARFGYLGWPTKSAPLKEIAGALPTQTSPLSGWGIRFTTRGMLFNVSGRGAVIVGMHNGKQFLIGTDEPETLADAINHALGRPPVFTMIRGAGIIPE